MVYAYAICPAGMPPLDLPGFGGMPLRTIDEGALVAVVSDCANGAPDATEENLWTHDQVVDALMADRTVLPTRFGTVLSGHDAVRDLLRERGPELEAALRRVAGAIELSVRVAWAVDGDALERADGARPGDGSSGSAYLTALIDRERRARELADRVDAPLRVLARERRRRLLARPNLPLSASYLVEREQAEAFRERVAQLGRELQDAEIVCTGPWAPYGFTSAPAAEAPA